MTYPVFPALPGLEYPVKRAPVAKALRQQAISGRRTLQPLWSAPLYKYEVSFALLRASVALLEWQQLEDFWKTVMTTPGGVFAFTDANDSTAANQAFGTGDGVTTSFQLMRALDSFAEPVLAPNATGLVVKVAGTTTSVTLGNYGIVTFASAPASGAALTWSGAFAWLCQFDEDSIEFDNFMYLFWELKKCAFTTWRP
jgi:uncharacterized protein (TIGR02217 family)